jgi:hypothetical protein
LKRSHGRNILARARRFDLTCVKRAAGVCPDAPCAKEAGATPLPRDGP